MQLMYFIVAVVVVVVVLIVVAQFGVVVTFVALVYCRFWQKQSTNMCQKANRTTRTNRINHADLSTQLKAIIEPMTRA